MNEAKRPNPSFFTLDISDRDRVAAVDAMIAERVADEDGNVLTWVGGSDYVLCRPAAKKLLLGGNRDDVAAFLRGLAFVRGVKFTRAGDVVRSFSERRVVDLPGDARPSPGKQWNLDTVNAREAWDMLPGPIDDKPWRAVRIGHLDTGYTEHPVLGFDGDGRSASVRADEGMNYFDGGGLPRDPLREFGSPGHGTRTMSVLNGYLPDTFSGVAPNATVVPYRVTDFVVIDTLWNRNPLDQAIEHAVFHTGCRVLSISLGDPCFPPSRVGKAIDRVYLAGSIVVAAAGNVTSEVVFPGRYAQRLR